MEKEYASYEVKKAAFSGHGLYPTVGKTMAIVLILLIIHTTSFVWIYEIYLAGFGKDFWKGSVIDALFFTVLLRVLLNYAIIVLLCMFGVIPASPEKYETTAFRSMYIGITSIAFWGALLANSLYGDA